MTFQTFLEQAFLWIVSSGVVVGVIILWRLMLSVSTLNSQIAVLLERTTSQGKTLDTHETRLIELEKRRAKNGFQKTAGNFGPPRRSKRLS